MSLTMGIGPFSRREGAGEANTTIGGPAHLLWFHDIPHRIRATFGGEVVVDTERARLLHETRLRPVHYLPRSDVRFDLLEPTDHRTHCPFKGDARYWSVRVGDRVAENAVWGYDDPIEGAPDLAPYVAFYFDRFDHWYEEDEELVGGPRDPFHRVDVRPSRRPIVVRVDGEVVAESGNALLLFETGLPTRYHLPPDAWRPGRIEPGTRTTLCPYKGRAQHGSVRTSAGVVDDVLWRFPQPMEGVLGVAGLWCADQDHERVEVEVGPGGDEVPGGRGDGGFAVTGGSR